MSPMLLQDVRKDAPFGEGLQHITTFLETGCVRNPGCHLPKAHQLPVSAIVRRSEERQSSRRILDRRIFRVIVSVDQRLFNQQSAHTVTEQQDGSGRLHVASFDPDLLEQVVCFPNECVSVLSVDRCRVVFEQEDP
jgi:hypothetical protein